MFKQIMPIHSNLFVLCYILRHCRLIVVLLSQCLCHSKRSSIQNNFVITVFAKIVFEFANVGKI